MKNIFLLNTEKHSRLYYDGTLKILPIPYLMKHSVNLYITSDDEIKEGGWFYDIIHNTILQRNDNRYKKQYKKIILTTDQTLINDGIKSVPEYFLEWFINNPTSKYIEILNQSSRNNVERKMDYKYKLILPKEYNTVQENSLEKNREFVKNTSSEVLNNLMKEFDNIEVETKGGVSLEELLSYYGDITIGEDHKLRLHSIIINAYNNGSNWRAERMYSEEDMIKAIKFGELYQKSGQKALFEKKGKTPSQAIEHFIKSFNKK